ncbi:hypothetical protein GGX14DRAFT_622974 [Mycena pura]|uniref:Uncharacterized protein n=1 Tax=Mycena pura TaxID=153505 RepID=A0AAD6YGI4_9AGAR|nr:hypothetical protein GGX14DRAFT_622974 [Mycena pura]
MTPDEPGWAGWPTTQQLAELSEKADGLFHYAATALQWIKQWIDENGMAHRDEIFNALTREREGGLTKLEDLYKLILTSFEDIDHQARNAIRRANRLSGFQHVIGTILMLYEPLTISQIIALLADIPKANFDVDHFLKQFRSVLIPSTTVFEEATPQMHKSFRDYITGAHAPTEFRVRTGNAHVVTAKSCLEVIVKAGSQTDIHLAGSQADIHVKYSIKHWYQHFQKAVEEDMSFEDERMWDLLRLMVGDAVVDVWKENSWKVFIAVATAGWKLLKKGTDDHKMEGISNIVMKAKVLCAFPLLHVLASLTVPCLLISRKCIVWLLVLFMIINLFCFKPYHRIWTDGLLKTYHPPSPSVL